MDAGVGDGEFDVGMDKSKEPAEAEIYQWLSH